MKQGLILLLIPVLAISCADKSSDYGNQASVGTLVCSPMVVDISESKSLITTPEDRLSSVSVSVYNSGGRIVRSEYSPEPTSIEFPMLNIGETYHIYAVFNVGELTFPVLESDLGLLTEVWNESEINAGGFPMVWEGSARLESESQSVNMEATRLISKIRFGVSNSSLTDHNGKFVASSIIIKNAARTISIFDEAQTLRGEDGYSSDAAAPEDIIAVNSGGKASFYTFENMCGTLLPGNTDPWNKVPSNISPDQDKCTYLEVTGTYSTDGGTCTAPVTYRMYLGDDATTNFDLRRNYIYDVTLVPSDEGIDRTSWKVTRGAFSDSRTLSFTPSAVTMNVNGSTTFTVIPTPSGMTYTVTGGPGFGTSTLTLTPAGNPNQYRLLSSGTLSSDAVTSVVATSWDGRVSTSLPVTVKAKYPTAAAVLLTKANIAPGETSTAYTEITYNDGTRKTVTTAATYFFSPVTSFATISGNVITAVSSGDVYVRATYTEAGKTVTAPAAKLHIYTVTRSLSINQGSSVQIGKGNVAQLTCTQKTYYDGSLHSSDNVTELASWANPGIKEYVLVSDIPGSKGQITGVKFGTVTVQTSYNGNTAYISVEVVRPDFELKVETSEARTGSYKSYITVYVMAIDPFSGAKTAVATVQSECSYSSIYPVTKSGGSVYVDFYPGGGEPPAEDQSAGFTATYTGDAGGKVKYGTRSASGTCRFKAEQ